MTRLSAAVLLLRCHGHHHHHYRNHRSDHILASEARFIGSALHVTHPSSFILISLSSFLLLVFPRFPCFFLRKDKTATLSANDGPDKQAEPVGCEPKHPGRLGGGWSR